MRLGVTAASVRHLVLNVKHGICCQKLSLILNGFNMNNMYLVWIAALFLCCEFSEMGFTFTVLCNSTSEHMMPCMPSIVCEVQSDFEEMMGDITYV